MGEARQKARFEIGQQGRKWRLKKREGRNGGGFGSSHQGKPKRVGQEYEIAERQSQNGERRVGNNAIRI